MRPNTEPEPAPPPLRPNLSPDYPRALHHASGKSKFVNSLEEEEQMGPEWHRQPHTAPPASTEAPVCESCVKLTTELADQSHRFIEAWDKREREHQQRVELLETELSSLRARNEQLDAELKAAKDKKARPGTTAG